MSVKAGQILHFGGTILMSRLQSAGPGQVNIPTEQVYETGNDNAVERLTDIPDISFDLESWDVTAEIEALLQRRILDDDNDGQEYDFQLAQPLNVISPYKLGKGLSAVRGGVIVPCLNLESATYRFGVTQNATQQFTLRGDSIYAAPGSPRYQEFTKSGVGPYTWDDTAVKTVEQGVDLYGLCVVAYETDGTYKRLFIGDDYTNTSTGFTLTAAANSAIANGSKLGVSYATAEVDNYADTIHPTATVKPGALKGRDIDFYVSDGAATPTMVRWRGVQSVEFNWRVQLDRDLELGNPHVVTQDYDTPEVTGNAVMRPEDFDYMIARIAQINGSSAALVQNALASTPLAVEARLNHPTTGATLKTIYSPDARFTFPGPQARVRSKTDITFPFASDTGDLKVYKGTRV